MKPDDFVQKWKAVTAGERAVAQSHFIDLCALLDVPNPVEADPTGASYAFERHVSKAARGKGFADVWKRAAFGWEYKGKGKDLGDAYRQLLLYRDDLENPPLLVVSDIDRIEVHTNFTGTTKAVHVYTLDDLLDGQKRAELRKVWTDPASFDPRARRERITQEAAAEIGRIALSLRDRGHDSQEVAHFVLQLVFALFAEDTRLLPNELLSKILARAENPERVQTYLSQLFEAMSTGGEVLLEDVPHFNGGLFDGQQALPLTTVEIGLLHNAAKLDWTEVEPAIFGTLFERSLDPAKRSQLGAHYTSRDDIMRIVEPVVMQPLQRRWDEVRAKAEEYLATEQTGSAKAIEKRRNEAVDGPIAEFLHELHSLRVLDPACGSGNFLYVALQSLKDLEHEVVTFAEQVGAPGLRLLGPRQFYGIEINPFARELASTVVWIGYLQWNRANGISSRQKPILEQLDNIVLHDALMNEDGSEYEWPEAEFIIGNPPFIGNRRMRLELGDEYVDDLRSLFSGRLSDSVDFVAYWFERARQQVCSDREVRAGLLATNSIRGGANRTVLERINDCGQIFHAWSDEPWVLDGAAVRVSIVCFGRDVREVRYLDGHEVESIFPDLTAAVNTSLAARLPANRGIAYQGVILMGDFTVAPEVAENWLPIRNPGGRPNSDVLFPYLNAQDVTRDSRRVWVVDFGAMPLDQASGYLAPFAYVSEKVRPYRERNRNATAREQWWKLWRPRDALRNKVGKLGRYVATPRVSKHRVFVWLSPETVIDNALVGIAYSDDYSFGVLHSRIHEVWSLALGTSLEDRPRYTPSTSFETFPFPETTEEQHQAISGAAKHLDDVRNHLLNADSSLTMTKLYNELTVLKDERDPTARAFPLLLAHERLDQAVATAYGWEWPLSDEEILGRLLELNLSQSGGGVGEEPAAESETES